MERTLQVLDYAILVISLRMLCRRAKQFEIIANLSGSTFIFVNKIPVRTQPRASVGTFKRIK